ncbi:MAG: hypothetical protein OEO23_12330, partial [Gemmatimonadota bacterium]|nr:hypothetical protein [Gemmatimonadota bacterium]
MSRLVPLVAFTLIWSACGGGDATPDASATSDDSRADAVAVPRVHITQPQDGAAVPQGPLEVVFEVEGLVVSPAGT